MKKYNLIAAFVFASCVFGANANGEDSKKESNFLKKIGTSCLNSASGCVKNVATYSASLVTDCTKDCIKETVKKTYTTFILDPYIINPIKNLVSPKTAEEIAANKIEKETASIMADAQKINQLRKAGVDKRVIDSLTAQLAIKIQASSMAVSACPTNCKK